MESPSPSPIARGAPVAIDLCPVPGTSCPRTPEARLRRPYLPSASGDCAATASRPLGWRLNQPKASADERQRRPVAQLPDAPAAILIRLRGFSRLLLGLLDTRQPDIAIRPHEQGRRGSPETQVAPRRGLPLRSVQIDGASMPAPDDPEPHGSHPVLGFPQRSRPDRKSRRSRIILRLLRVGFRQSPYFRSAWARSSHTCSPSSTSHQ